MFMFMPSARYDSVFRQACQGGVMLRILLPFALCIGNALTATEPTREVISQANLVGNQLVPGFYKGYVYFLGEGRPSQLRLYAPDGHLVLVTDVQGSRNFPPDLRGLAVDTDGTIAVSYVDTNNRNRGGIEFLDSTGVRIRVIDTERYLAGNLCYGEDHSLWSFGFQHDKDDLGRADRQDYMTVRKYSGGREVGAYLRRSGFPGGLEPGTESWQQMRIAVAHDRIGLLAWRRTSNDLEWVELDLKGNLIGRWKFLGGSEPSFAYTSDSHLYALRLDPEAKIHRLSVFDRASSAWKEIEAPFNGGLYGADGDELVFADWEHGPMHLRWFKQPTVKP
jgi:hypothetical protein